MTKQEKAKQAFSYMKKIALVINSFAFIIIALSGTNYSDGHFLLYAIILGWGLCITSALERIIELLERRTS